MNRGSGIITLLTDFGAEDSYVGAMKGVILSIHPRAAIVDISHEIPPHDIQTGAFVLSQAALFFPKGTVHIAVVDPGVGGKRRPICIETERHFFVGPDNGIFDIALWKEKTRRTIHLTNRDYFLKHVSSTFHGRDIFSPVAAYLSLGINPALLGKKITRIKARIERPVVHKGGIFGHVIHVDRFGNLITNIDEEMIARAFQRKTFEIKAARHTIQRLVPSYSQAKTDEAVGVIGSSGLLEIAMRETNASKELGIQRGSRVVLHIKPKRVN